MGSRELIINITLVQIIKKKTSVLSMHNISVLKLSDDIGDF